MTNFQFLDRNVFIKYFRYTIRKNYLYGDLIPTGIHNYVRCVSWNSSIPLDADNRPKYKRLDGGNINRGLLARSQNNIYTSPFAISMNLGKVSERQWIKRLHEICKHYAFNRTGDHVVIFRNYMKNKFPNYQNLHRTAAQITNYLPLINKGDLGFVRKAEFNAGQVRRLIFGRQQMGVLRRFALNTMTISQPYNHIMESSSDILNNNAFLNLWKVFAVAHCTLLPNKPNSSCYYSVKRYLHGHVEAPNLLNVRGQTANHYTLWHNYTRLSRNINITLMTSLTAAVDFYFKMVKDHKEHYSTQITSVTTPERTVWTGDFYSGFLEINATKSLNWEIAQIRGSNDDSLNKILDGYKNHHNWGVRQNYKKLQNFLDLENFKIINPRTNKNCLYASIVLGMRENDFYEYPDYITLNKKETKKKNQAFKNAAQAIKRNIETDENVNYLIPKNFFQALTTCKNYHHLNFEIYDFTGSLMKKYDCYHLKDKLGKKIRCRKKNFGKTISILIGRGHAFGLVHRKEPRIIVEEDEKKRNIVKGFEKIKGSLIDPEFYEKEYSLGVFDIETTSDTVKPYAVGFYYETLVDGVLKNDYLPYYGLDCMEKLLFQIANMYIFEGGPLFLFAHNGGAFDFHFFINALNNCKDIKFTLKRAIEVHGSLLSLDITLRNEYYKYKKTKNGGEKAIITWSKPVKIILRDSLPLFAHNGLSKLTENYQVPHLKGDLPHHKITEETFEKWTKGKKYPKLKKYLEHDVRGLVEVLKKFKYEIQDKFDVDPLQCLTTSSVVRKIFFKRYYDKKNLFILPKGFNDKVKKAYYGGRVELGFLGEVKGPIYYYDFTSLYPAQFLKPIPFGEPIEIDVKKLDLGVFQGLLKVEVQGKSDNGINILPFRTPAGLIFPDFEQVHTQYYWSAEIKLAIEHGYKIKILRAWEFQTDSRFSDFVKILFEMKKKAKKEGRKSLEFLAKVLINSLYGFWAIRIYNIAKLVIETANLKNPDPIARYLETDQLISSRSDWSIHYMRVRENLKCGFYYPAISCAVTSHARIQLWHLLSDIKEKGGRVLYMDTDSIITDYCIENDKELFDKYVTMNNGAELGMLKNEFGLGKFADSWIGIAPKVYAFKGKKIPRGMEKPKFKGFYKRKNWTRSINPTARIIHFDINDKKSKTEDELTYRDLKLMDKGWKIRMKTWRFSGKTTAYMVDGKVTKPTVEIEFKKGYVKGKVLESGDIIPLKI